MREPVAVIIGRDLFLVRTVRLHPPDLHQAGAVGIEINIFSIRGVFRAVIIAGRGGEPGFFAAGNRDGVNIKLAVALGAIGQRFAVGRPAVPVGRRQRRDLPRRTALNRQHENAGFVADALVADDELRSIGGNAVVIVAMDGRAGVQQLRLAARDRQFVNPPVAVEVKQLSIARPVRRLDVVARAVNHAPVAGGKIIGGGNADDFQHTLGDGIRIGGGCHRRQFHVGKHGLLQGIVVVRAHGEADVEIVFERQAQGTAGRFQRPAGRRKGHGNVIAAFFEPQPGGRGNVRLDFMRRAAGRFPELQRCQSGGVPESLASELARYVRREFGVVGTRFVLRVVGDGASRERECVWSGALDAFGGVFRWRRRHRGFTAAVQFGNPGLSQRPYPAGRPTTG
jgi:hypothetical protein